MAKHDTIFEQIFFLHKKPTKTFSGGAPFKIHALLPAVLITDREHAASVGDLNLSEALLTNQRASCPKTLPPLIAEPQSPSPRCHITGPAFLVESSPCSCSCIHRELWRDDTSCRGHTHRHAGPKMRPLTC